MNKLTSNTAILWLDFLLTPWLTHYLPLLVWSNMTLVAAAVAAYVACISWIYKCFYKQDEQIYVHTVPMWFFWLFPFFFLSLSQQGTKTNNLNWHRFYAECPGWHIPWKFSCLGIGTGISWLTVNRTHGTEMKVPNATFLHSLLFLYYISFT